MRRFFRKHHLLSFLLLSLSIIILLFASGTYKEAQKIQNTTLELSQTKQTPVSNLIQQAGYSAQLQENLTKYLTVESALLGAQENISLYFKDLSNPATVSINPQRSWIPASTIKAYVVLEAFRQRRQGLIDFNTIVTINADNVVPTELELDEFPRLHAGTQVTIRQLVEAMIIQSDNTAYNTLLDILDRRNINATLQNLGLTETIVGEKLNLDDNQFQADLQVPGRQSNTTTAKDYLTLFDILYSKKLPDSDEILSIFKRQRINNMLPMFLPTGTVIAHKTGDWAPIYHDGGIIYKPKDPFIFVVFTNNNDPNVIAKLGQVAYYQNADSVGKDLPVRRVNETTKNKKTSYVYIAQNTIPQKVLGTSTQQYPSITAADLGITSSDLTDEKSQSKDLSPALITPDSFFYPMKRLLEEIRLKLLTSNSSKTDYYIALSKARLSEAKAILSKNQLTYLPLLLSDSESSLKNASQIAKDMQDNTSELISIQRTNNLHFSTFSKYAKNFKSNAKQQYVDLLYAFYQRNQKEVLPVVKKAQISNPVEITPEIATVKSIQGDRVTLQFSNGTNKTVDINSATKLRDFHSKTADQKNQLKEGNKIALVAEQDKSGKLTPIFILRNVPKEVPSIHQGVILKINPSQQSIDIKDNTGKTVHVEVNQETIIKGKDTGVSLEGIKAGSTISVVGSNNQPPVKSSVDHSNNVSVDASTVTVTSNNSGKNEQKIEDKKTETKPQQSEPSKSNPSSDTKKADSNDSMKKDESKNKH